MFLYIFGKRLFGDSYNILTVLRTEPANSLQELANYLKLSVILEKEATGVKHGDHGGLGFGMFYFNPAVEYLTVQTSFI